MKNEVEVAVPKGKRTGLSICVFCSAVDLPDIYTQDAKEIARLIAKNGYDLVWGGSSRGLMEVVAAGAQDGGSKLVGVSIERFKTFARSEADEMIFAEDLGERKALMLERSDAVIALIGGIGTLNEITEIIEFKKHKLHDKPIVILDTAGFYDGLKQQLQKMDEEKFLVRPLDEMVFFASSPQEAIDYINSNLSV